MAIDFSNLKSSKRLTPPIISIYGSGGMGKTALAAEFPRPFYLYAKGEGTPNGADLPCDLVTNFDELQDDIMKFINDDHPFETVIIDSLDKIEPMLWARTCQRMKWDSIDSNEKGAPTAFGKGYLEADHEWRHLFLGFHELTNMGINVVLIIHDAVKKFDDPMVESYDRYRPSLQSRAVDCVVHNSDALIFINKRMSVKTVDKGFGRTGGKAEGKSGKERILYTDERAGFLAKNRMGMPPEITYRLGQGYAELSKYFYTTEVTYEE